MGVGKHGRSEQLKRRPYLHALGHGRARVPNDPMCPRALGMTALRRGRRPEVGARGCVHLAIPHQNTHRAGGGGLPGHNASAIPSPQLLCTSIYPPGLLSLPALVPALVPCRARMVFSPSIRRTPYSRSNPFAGCWLSVAASSLDNQDKAGSVQRRRR